MLNNLPASIRALVISGNVQAVIPNANPVWANALITNANMIDVWGHLLKMDPEGILASEFFEEVVTAEARWRRISKVPTTSGKHALKKLQDLMLDAADALDQREGEILLHRGLPLTVDQHIEGQSDADPVSASEMIRHWANDVAQALRYPSQALAAIPTKPNQGGAIRTYIARVVASFLRERIGQVKWDHVAAVVSTVCTPQIDSNLAMKLCREKKF